jgi:hypothetical protein
MDAGIGDVKGREQARPRSGVSPGRRGSAASCCDTPDFRQCDTPDFRQIGGCESEIAAGVYRNGYPALIFIINEILIIPRLACFARSRFEQRG